MVEKRVRSVVLLLLGLCLSVVAGQHVWADDNWELIIDKNGVQVYTRETPDSSIDEFKGITVVNARMEVIGEVLRNIKDHPKWIDRCKETRIVKTFEDGSVIAHVITDIPWPASTRDVVLKQSLDVSLDEEKGTITISILFHSIDYPDIPPLDGVIRIKDLTGKYILEYIDRDHTRVIFQTKTDPIGALPSALANFGSRTVPYKTLYNLHKEVEKPQYKTVATDPANINQENLYVAKLILKTQMKKYVKDEALINSMVTDDLVKQILMGKELKAKDAAKIIMETQLKKRTSDQSVIDDIINDDELVARLLKNKSMTEKDAAKLILESQLEKRTHDRQVIDEILNDEAVIQKIMNKKPITEKEVADLIEDRI